MEQPERVSLPTPPRVTALWRRYPAEVAALRHLLESDVFKQAQATLTTNAMPGFQNAMAGDDSTKARSNSWLAGYCDAFRDLQRLANLPPETTTATQDVGEWDLNTTQTESEDA